MSSSKFLVTPHLLRNRALHKETEVFLCGPTPSKHAEDLRGRVRKYLERSPNTKVLYGEELEDTKRFRFPDRVDLQTLEAAYAEQVDFTVLLLDSPGAIAELGTFSMIPSIRERLYVLVRLDFYRVGSYIERGSLSLIASKVDPSNIFYYRDENDREVFRGINLAITKYKFINNEAREYKYLKSYGIIDDPQNKKYLDLTRNYKERFFDSIVLIAIIVLGRPTFPEIVRALRLAPDQVQQGLSRLFKTKSIQLNKAIYSPTNGYNDKRLESFNTTEISKLRAQVVAAT